MIGGQGIGRISAVLPAAEIVADRRRGGAGARARGDAARDADERVTAAAQAAVEPAAGRRVAYRTCSLCEATCGLELTVVDGRVERIRGDDDDVFSRGFVCPKGASLGQLHDDPDRLRAPLVRGDDGELREATWRGGVRRVAELLEPILAEHGADAVATYIGNPMGQSLSGNLYLRGYHKALGTQAAVHGRHGRPAPEVARERAPLRHAVQRRRARPRPHRPPAPPRREPGRLAGQPRRGARHPHPAARHPRARRPDRRDRPAADAHGPRGGRAPLRAPRDGRAPARRARRDALRGGARRARPARASTSRGSTRCATSACASRPSGSPTRCGIEATVVRRLARELAGGRAGGRLRALRDDDAGVRHRGELARRRPQRAHGEPRPARRRDVRDACDGRADVQRPARHAGAASSSAAGAPASRGVPEVLGELTVGVLAEEIATDGAGTGARARHVLGEPGPLVPERHAARRGRSRPSTASSRSTRTSTRRRATRT